MEQPGLDVALARAIGRTGLAGVEGGLPAALVARLRAYPALLVLDDAEHLLEDLTRPGRHPRASGSVAARRGHQPPPNRARARERARGRPPPDAGRGRPARRAARPGPGAACPSRPQRHSREWSRPSPTSVAGSTDCPWCSSSWPPASPPWAPMAVRDRLERGPLDARPGPRDGHGGLVDSAAASPRVRAVRTAVRLRLAVRAGCRRVAGGRHAGAPVDAGRADACRPRRRQPGRGRRDVRPAAVPDAHRRPRRGGSDPPCLRMDAGRPDGTRPVGRGPHRRRPHGTSPARGA